MKKLVCFAFLICTAHIYSQKDFSIAAIPKELTEYSNSVLIDELVEIDVTDVGKMKEKTHRVIAVLNKLGDGDTRLYEYYDSNSRVKNIEVRIYNAFGKEIEHFKKKDFKDVSRTGISMYSDDRMMGINYTPTTYPYIAVFESETETGNTAFFKPWYPLKGFAESTLKYNLKIKFDPLNKPKYKPNNLDGYNISISEGPDELLFSASNLQAIRYEEHSPSRDRILPNVTLALNNFMLEGSAGSSADWQQFGNWVNKSLLSDVGDLPEGTLARVKSLVANETTNEGKARKIYQFVQDKVRYISIQIGIGGWKPMPASEVDKLSYGDCKALTNYTKALLEAVDVPAYYTLINAGNNKIPIEEDFAFLWFNHAILGIPDGDEITWLECTSQDKPYGYMGDFTDDRDVIIMTPEGGKIAHTKMYETEENTQENTANVSVDANGNVTATLKSVSKGLQYDDDYKLPKEKQEDLEGHYKKKWNYINGFSITDINLNNNREEVIFTEELSLNIPNYANPVGSDYLFCANIFNQNQYIPPRIESRKQNLYIANGAIDVDTVTVDIPDNFTIEGLPEATVLKTKFGKYQIDFNISSDNKLTYTRKLTINKGEYPPSEYENFRDFLRSVARLDKTKILLKQNIQ